VTDADDVSKLLKDIVDAITPILSDIKSNTKSALNIQVSQANKVKLKEIAKKLESLKSKIIPLYHLDYKSGSTTQTSLNIK
tara:strand:+ start:1230 stop:1472 length:243 start_codon:yes stop_codon:yes gene_type:complete